MEYRVLTVEGEERSFALHRPEGVKAHGAPLILAFHGYRMTGLGLQRLADLDRIARDLRAVIVYPDAASSYWAEDCDCIEADVTHGVADTVFVSAMIDGLTTEFDLDPTRVYGVGFSQGGLFVQRLACQMAHRFQAFVEVASTIAGPMADRCEPSKPVGLLTIISQRDGSFPWEGYSAGNLSTLGGEETAQLWGQLNQCSMPPQRNDEDGILRVEYHGCAGGTRVKLIGPEDGDHSWEVSPGIDTRKEIVAFLTG